VNAKVCTLDGALVKITQPDHFDGRSPVTFRSEVFKTEEGL